MDLFDLIDHQLDYLDYSTLQRTSRVRVFKPRVDYFNELDETEFLARFRLSKCTVNQVHNLIKHKIMSKTQRNHAVSTEISLLLTLRYLATGSYLRSAADFCGVSPPTASRIVKKVTEAIAQLRPDTIKFPDNISTLQKGFYQIARFPRVIALDCTHVTIQSPGGDSAENYRNRKSHFSINVQVVCDSQLRCLDIVTRWPGSVHDQTIFNNSFLKQRFESGQFGNSLILGDSGYELKQYLLTPFLNPSSPAENLYNEAHIRTRNTVERCFGVCKNRFPVLRRQITLNLNRVQAIIVACFVLHNIAIDANDRNFEDYSDSHIEPHEENLALSGSDFNNNTRNRLVQEYFLPLLNNNTL
ncbi:hypothetical protein SFRURICE_004436 [Spodoptera frugiperda]|nr:hypothetical protein SFRURICE_004436 [Spodoptera frugiperda]